jgi:hypothetical protein
MKTFPKWLWILALAWVLGSCEKPSTAVKPEPATVIEEVPSAPTPAPVPAVVSLSADERAAKLGFARHLPQDTEGLLAFYNGSKSVSRFKQSGMWKFVEFWSNRGVDEIPDSEEEEMIPPDAEQDPAANEEQAVESDEGPAALFSQEFTIALGNSAGDQIATLLKFNDRSGYFQMRSIAKAFAEYVKSGEVEVLKNSVTDSFGFRSFKELLSDSETGLPLLEKLKMPPLYMAFKPRPESRESSAQLIAATIANLSLLGEMVEPVEVTSAGCEFAGFRLLGARIAAGMEANRESMEEEFGADLFDRLLAIIAKKDMVVISGTVGDYVVLFFGASLDELKFAPETGESLVANEALAFADAYASKEICMLLYGEKEASNVLADAVGGLSEMSLGLRDGFAAAEGLGDTRDLEMMLQLVAEREGVLRKLSTTEAVGTVAHFEDGLKVESYGGTDSGMMDWDSPRKLSHLADSEDVVLFVGNVSNKEYAERASAYLEAVLETGYAMTMKFAAAPVEVPEMKRFREWVTLFDNEFRMDTVAMWEALGKAADRGLGAESAWVVDLKGSMPAVPGVSRKVLDEVRIPRISWIAPVTDRASLSTSWDQMDSTLAGIFQKLGKIMGTDIPMQKPIRSQQDGNTSWFFAMPFLTDEFLPSLTVGDRWFAASTSKNQALDLIAKADGAGESRAGLWMTVNFAALQSYARETYPKLDGEVEALDGVTKDQAEAVIGVFDDLDKLTLHIRREGGVQRSSLHLMTR